MIIIKQNYNIKEISYLKVGGIVKSFVLTDDIKCLKDNYKNQIIIGNTSKLLFCFNKSDYCIIKFIKNDIIDFKNTFFVYAGALLSKVYSYALKNNIKGWEYLSTIPGTIGGSINNNSSFLKQCISDYLIKCLVIKNGKLFFMEKKDCQFSYRNSIFNQNKQFFIIGALFKKEYSDKNKIIENYHRAIEYRKTNIENYLYNLGSTFKNNEFSIGKVLDSLHFKNYQYSNNVKISQKHANIILVKPNTEYLEIYHLITFLKCVLYYYLEDNISLEIQLIT